MNEGHNNEWDAVWDGKANEEILGKFTIMVNSII